MQAIRSSDDPLTYKLEGASLITSLPYADENPDKADYKAVKRLVQKELEDMEKAVVPHVSLESLAEDVETPCIEFLGKRASSAPKEKEVTRDEYDQAVIDLEQLKDR